MRRGALNINRETAAGLRAALVGAVPLRRPPLCRAAKAFTRITTGVPRLDSLAAAAAHSHCICTSLIGGAPGGRGRAYAARHRACGPLAVRQQPPRSDAAQLALHYNGRPARQPSPAQCRPDPCTQASLVQPRPSRIVCKAPAGRAQPERGAQIVEHSRLSYSASPRLEGVAQRYARGTC